MRYPIHISTISKPVLKLFGMGGSYVELTADALLFHFGTAHERVPLAEVAEVSRRKWPLYYGIGARIVPGQGVGYVGSTEGVVQIRFANPRPMNVWGPFRLSAAESVSVSLEHPDVFIDALRAALR